MVHTIIQQLKKSRLFTSIIICGSYFFTLPYRLFKSQKVTFGKNFISHWKLKVSGPGKVIFGNNVNAGAYSEPNIFTTFHPDAQIRIGDNCRLNGIHAQSHSNITIGNNCIIGSAILIDTDFHSTEPDRLSKHKSDSDIRSQSITIGDNAWICGQSAILKGVSIGDNSIVGFRAVVTKNVPPNTVVAGNPARIVKRLGTK